MPVTVTSQAHLHIVYGGQTSNDNNAVMFSTVTYVNDVVQSNDSK